MNIKFGSISGNGFKVKFKPNIDNITLKNQSGSGARFDTLNDVDTSTEGEVLVYDEETDTYKHSDKLDGGDF